MRLSGMGVKRVLVVNDEPDELELISVLLRQSGYEILTAYGGREGVGVAQQERPDLIISDMSMPHLDGIELCRLMRRHPELRTTPIILTSALREGSERVVAGLKAGADDFLELTSDPMRLAASVARLIEQKRAEEGLRDSEELYHATFNNAPVGIGHIAPDGRWLRVNRYLCGILGYTREELLARSLRETLHAEDVEADDEARRQLLAGQIESYAREKRCVRKDGSVVWVNVAVKLQSVGAGEPTYFITVLQDITGRKELEQQLLQAQKMEAVGRLAGGIAHDFDNLLTAIIRYSEILLARGEKSVEGDLQEIKKAGERVATLTRQLLAFGGKQALQPKVLDLNSMVTDLSEMLRRLAGEDIEFALLPSPDLGRIFAEPGQVEQVLINLVVNARDAMPQGGRLVIEIRNVELDEAFAGLHPGAQPGSHVQFSVSDTGEGLGPEIQGRIFEPFFTTKEVGKGTGLGLSAVYGIVKQSGGSVWVYSEVGRITTFNVFLPRVEETETLHAAPAQKPLPRGSETILLVEDEALVRSLAKRILEVNGYRVFEASNGEEALRLCRQYEGRIDLMITDIEMPLVSGRELAERVAPLEPGMRVLFVSGRKDEAVLRHGVLSAGVPFLEKPYTPSSLLHKMKEVLAREG
jgi:PAS domain S-box-containing protein